MSEPNPVDLANFIQAVLDIARDPAAWEARVSAMSEYAKRAADSHAAAADLAVDAETHRVAAETALANAAVKEASVERWSAQVDAKEKALADREGRVSDRETAVKQLAEDIRFRQGKADEAHNTLDHRTAELAEREQAAAQTLAEAQTLMADYDKAKHDAALKLVS